MTNETMKQGIAGASYDPSKVFDPSKQKVQAIAEPPKTGLDVSQNAGISTIAGAGYYAGRSMPSGPPQNIAGVGAGIQATPVTATPKAQPIGDIAGTPAQSSASQPTDKVPAIAGVNAFSFNSKQPAGGVVANNSSSDWSPGSNNARAIAGTSGLNIGPTSFTHTFSNDQGQQTVEPIGTLSNRGIAGLSYDEQVNRAKQINADSARQLALTPSPKEASAMAILKDPGASLITKRNATADLAGFTGRKTAYELGNANNQETQLAGIKAKTDMFGDTTRLEGTKYTADLGLAGHAVDAVARMAGTQAKAGAEVQKQYADRVKGLVSDWSKLNVPTDVAPKLNYYAQLHAQAEDPNGKIFMLSPNRQGGQYAALPKQYEPHYQNLLKSGLSHNDAAARVYTVAKQNGHTIDVPDFNRFQTKKAAEKLPFDMSFDTSFGG